MFTFVADSVFSTVLQCCIKLGLAGLTASFFGLFVCFLFYIPERSHKLNCLKERIVPWFNVKKGDLFCCRWFKKAFSYFGAAEYNCTIVLQLSLEYSFRMEMLIDCNFVNSGIDKQQEKSSYKAMQLHCFKKCKARISLMLILSQ